MFKNDHCVFQGANASQLEKEIGADHLLSNEHFYGLVNVIIALYYLSPNECDVFI